MTKLKEQQEDEQFSFAELPTKFDPPGFQPARSADVAATPALPKLRAADTGLPTTFIAELLLKIIHRSGHLRLWALSEQTRLPVAVIAPQLDFLRGDGLCEVALPDPDKPSADVAFQLTSAGRDRAKAALQKCRYIGPAPVSLDAYVAQVERQSAACGRVSPQALDEALAGVVVHERLRDDLGAALNSGRPILIHGPSGSGKTFIAEHLGAALGGYIYVPHAILVDGDVIQIYDPMVHHAVPEATAASALGRWTGTDRRWVLCRRPVVISGGELTLAALDLQFDAHSRFYVAPPQIKANNGIFIIDDLGRQQVSPQDLMNRWIVPLDRRVDHFVLHTGMRFRVPFHLSVIFSSNLRPSDLADEAFLRRLGYKIHVGELSESDYRKVFEQACTRNAIHGSDAAFEYLVRRLHAREGRPLLACTPVDLVAMVRDRAVYRDQPAELTDDALDWAWHTYFAAE
jgi:predicted ATPase with chaperone activity